MPIPLLLDTKSRFWLNKKFLTQVNNFYNTINSVLLSIWPKRHSAQYDINVARAILMSFLQFCFVWSGEKRSHVSRHLPSPFPFTLCLSSVMSCILFACDRIPSETKQSKLWNATEVHRRLRSQKQEKQKTHTHTNKRKMRRICYLLSKSKGLIATRSPTPKLRVNALRSYCDRSPLRPQNRPGSSLSFPSIFHSLPIFNFTFRSWSSKNY